MNHFAGRRFLRVGVAGFHIIALALLALSGYVRSLPPTSGAIPGPADAESVWWGLWPLTYLPEWIFAPGAAIIVGVIVFFWLGQLVDRTDADEFQANCAQTWPNSRGQQILLALLSLTFVLSFFLFPIVHTRWGDAFLISRSMAWPDEALRLTHSWQAPLDVFLHGQIWALVRVPLDLPWKDASPIYRVVSPLAGALYLGVVLALSRRERLAPCWLTFGLLTTLGLMQLFFGYVENYSFAAAGVLAYLWLGLETLWQRRPLWLAASILAITHAIHPSTVVLTPSLIFLAWMVFRRGNQSLRNVVLETLAPMLVVGLSTLLLMESGGHGIDILLTSDRPGGSDARWFVPLLETTTRWEQYTMFSWLHLRDFLNEQLLIAPVVLPALVWCAALLIGRKWPAHRSKDGRTASSSNATSVTSLEAQDRYEQERNSLLIFLLIASALYWLFIWVWNPDYGGQRDWDLFSLAALPSTLLLVALLPRIVASRRYLIAASVPLILLQAFYTLAWIYQNTLPWEWPD